MSQFVVLTYHLTQNHTGYFFVMLIQGGKLVQGLVNIGTGPLIFVETAKHLARTMRHSTVLRQVAAFTVIRTPIFQSPVNVLEVAKGNKKRSKREPEQDNAIRKYRSS